MGRSGAALVTLGRRVLSPAPRGHQHNESLRALANRLLELLFDLRRLHRISDEAVHAANIRLAT